MTSACSFKGPFVPQEKNQRQRQAGLWLTQGLLGTWCTLGGTQKVPAHLSKGEVLRGSAESSRTSPLKAGIMKTKGSGQKKTFLGSWDKSD